MKFSEILDNSHPFIERNKSADEQIQKINSELSSHLSKDKYSNITIFCGGSLGRGDVGKKSDLDLFILSKNKPKEERRLDVLKLLSTIITVNDKLNYPEFSNDGQFITTYSFPDMLEALGSPKDDNENLFTVRMLLLLESKCVFNIDIYKQFIRDSIDHYFRDKRGKKTFKPLFLLNDLLRFWRTLCLNYELIRDNRDRPWRKKNINLKFSRMLTVFATILPIISDISFDSEKFQKLVTFPPLKRLAIGLDNLNDEDLLNDFNQFLLNYEFFLKAKEDMGSKKSLDDATLDRKIREIAKDFSDFLFTCLTHQTIKHEYKKYLIL